MKKKEVTKLTERHVSRRQFLAGAGATVALPPLLSLMPKAVAQTVVAEKKLRLCLLATEFGMIGGHLFPNSTALSGKLTSVNSVGGQSVPSIQYAQLKDIADPISYVVDANIADLKSEMNLIAGLDLMSPWGHNFGFYAGSGPGRMLTSGRSIDVIVSESAAFKKSFKGSVPIVRNYNYYFGGGFFYDRKKDASGNFLLGEDNCIEIKRAVSDKDIFNSLFSGLSSNITPTSPEVTRKKLLIDLVKPDYDSLKTHKRISSNDKYLLGQYAEGLFQIESNLQIPSQSCAQPTAPTFVAPTWEGPTDWEVYWKNISQMMIMAFQCDISRIYATSPSMNHMHHQVDESAEEMYGSKWQKVWLHIMARYLIRGLKNTVDPFGNGESLLENSLVVWHNEHEGRAHGHASIPVMTFGALGGKIRQGYYMNFQQPNKPHPWRGYPSKMMMVSILEAMGVTRAEILKEGDGKGFGSWPSYLWYENTHAIGEYYDLKIFEAGAGSVDGPFHSKALPFFTKV